MSDREKKVTHLILGLGKGGAETMLYQILKYQTAEAPKYKVVSLGLSHYYESKIRYLEIPVKEACINRNPFKIVRSIITIRKEIKDADVLCCWMYGANLLGYLLKHRQQKIIWCIRHSDLNPENNSRKTILFSKVCAKLSKNVPLVAYNGYKAGQVHKKAGYIPQNSIVLNNGLDIDEYRKIPEYRKNAREELGISDGQYMILSVARDSKIKDLPTFIKMMALIRKKHNDAIGVMCGVEITESNESLTYLCGKKGLRVGADIKLIGFRDDVIRLMNAADVYVLHSLGEAFPNTIIQAMACKTPVVTTDVGDVRNILSSNAFISAPGDHKALAENVCKLLELDEKEKRIVIDKNRRIVEDNYDIKNIVKDYERAFTG